MLVDMIEKIRELAEKYLDEGRVDGVLALKRENGHVGPHLFLKGEDIGALEIEPKHTLGGVVAIALASGAKKIAIIGRGCDERTLLELTKRYQVGKESIEFIGLACSAEQAQACECDRPWPEEIIFGEKVDGVVPPELANVNEMSLDDRYKYWKDVFAKCIKCYGCKNACPVCICRECVLEDQMWVKKGEVPPAFPLFHLIRAFHMADRCVHCYECEEACPAGIPLTLIYRQLREDMSELFDYLPGVADGIPPLATVIEDEELEEGA
jgi:ferredoxin